MREEEEQQQQKSLMRRECLCAGVFHRSVAVDVAVAVVVVVAGFFPFCFD